MLTVHFKFAQGELSIIYTILQPFLLGKARVPFRRLLMARSSSRVEVDVMSSVTDKRGTGIGEDVSERTLGRLTVRTSVVQHNNVKVLFSCSVLF